MSSKLIRLITLKLIYFNAIFKLDEFIIEFSMFLSLDKLLSSMKHVFFRTTNNHNNEIVNRNRNEMKWNSNEKENLYFINS